MKAVQGCAKDSKTKQQLRENEKAALSNTIRPLWCWLVDTYTIFRWINVSHLLSEWGLECRAFRQATWSCCSPLLLLLGEAKLLFGLWLHTSPNHVYYIVELKGTWFKYWYRGNQLQEAVLYFLIQRKQKYYKVYSRLLLESNFRFYDLSINKFFLLRNCVFDALRSISKHFSPQWLHIFAHTIISHYSLMKSSPNVFNEFRKLCLRQLGQLIYLYDQKEKYANSNMIEVSYL